MLKKVRFEFAHARGVLTNLGIVFLAGAVFDLLLTEPAFGLRISTGMVLISFATLVLTCFAPGRKR